MSTKGKVEIVLDPGHGGKDPGATAGYGVREKDLNLKAVLEIYRRTKEHVFYNRSVTRYKDQEVHSDKSKDLMYRGILGKNADLFCSIHCDSFTDSKARGFSIYYNYNSPRSKEFAQILAPIYAEKSGLPVHTIACKLNSAKNNDYYGVLRAIPDTTPAIIFELGFLSNEIDRNYLISPFMPATVAESFILAMDKFFTYKIKTAEQANELEIERLINILDDKRRIILDQSILIQALYTELENLKKYTK